MIIVNLLLLLNLVIAIMSDTYANLSQVKLGLYLQGIIESISSYKNDKRYGGLICMTPPFNVIAYLLLPFYHCTKDKDKLARFNNRVCQVTYFPLAFLFTTILLAGSILMSPLAWLKAVSHHIRQRKSNVCNALFYTFLGLPWFILIAIVDAYWCFCHLYMWKKTRTLNAMNYPKISLRAFNRFYLTVIQLQGEHCNGKMLVKKLEKQFRTSECIFGVLYTNKSSYIEEIQNTQEGKELKLQAHGEVGTVKNAHVNISNAHQNQLNEGIQYNLHGL